MATNLLVGQHERFIKKDYENALELSHRLHSNNPLLHTYDSFTNETKLLLSQVNSLSNLYLGFNEGITLFFRNILEADMKNLQSLIRSYCNQYEITHKNTRQQAVQYVKQAVNELQDLLLEINSAPNVYYSLYDAHWFFSSVLKMLDKCIISNRWANSYLAQVRKLEDISANGIYSPESFYNSSINTEKCTNLYLLVEKKLKELAPILSFMHNRLLSWLQNNSDIYSKSDVFEIYSNQANVSPNSKSNAKNYLGLWSILQCDKCNKIFKVTNSTLNSKLQDLNHTMSDSVANCLLQYEKHLYNVLMIASQVPKRTPIWSKTETLHISLNFLTSLTEQINDMFKKFIKGYETGINVINSIHVDAYTMKGSVIKIQQEISSSFRKWQNSVEEWSHYSKLLYLSVTNSLSSLLKFTRNNKDLKVTISRLKIWLKPKILLVPVPQIVNNITNGNETAKNLARVMESHLNFNAAPIINSTLTFVAHRAIVRPQRLVESTVLLCYSWLSELSHFMDSLDAYNKSFVVDEAFVK